MKKSLILILSLGLMSFASAATHVNGYYKSNGTYVQPHYRSTANSTTSDNWSVAPNVNPYTGKQGTLSPSYSNTNIGLDNKSNSVTNCYPYCKDED